ncbi:hypothetical protein Esti_004066 [Eimeria stiedai]
MCAKVGLPLLWCVRRLGGVQHRQALPRSCGVSAYQSPRFLFTANNFAAAAAERRCGPDVSSTGRGTELAENWRSLSSLSSRDSRKLRSSSPSDAVEPPVSQQEATSEEPSWRQSQPHSSSSSSSEASSNEDSSSSNSSKSNGNSSKSEGWEGAFGGRDETAELQRLVRERQQRQADVIPFKVRRTVGLWGKRGVWGAASDNLPVNLSWSHSRSQVRTVIRKVGGDRQVGRRASLASAV